MKRIVLCVFACAALGGCGLEETCENEASMVSLSVGSVPFRIDSYEASRTNATSATVGTGITMACNTRGVLPWNNVTYEDARNACLDAGKRLCTQQEWQAACGTAYPYGNSYQLGTCNDGDGLETSATGAKAGCRSTSGIFDMSGNVAEWVEGGILMGGGYNFGKGDVMCTSAKKMSESSASQTTGFRCCQDVSLSQNQ